MHACGAIASGIRLPSSPGLLVRHIKKSRVIGMQLKLNNKQQQKTADNTRSTGRFPVRLAYPNTVRKYAALGGNVPPGVSGRQLCRKSSSMSSTLASSDLLLRSFSSTSFRWWPDGGGGGCLRSDDVSDDEHMVDG